MRYAVSAAVGLGLLLTVTVIPLPANKCTHLPATNNAENRRLFKGTNNDYPSRYFVSAMVAQSSQGLALARDIERFSCDTELTNILDRIGLSQKTCLDEMRRWQKTNRKKPFRLDVGSTKSFIRLMQEVRQTTKQDMAERLSGEKHESSFVAAMIAHGHGTIDMAKVFLIFEGDKELSRIADTIIMEQQSHIRNLQSWLSVRNHS